MSANGSKGSGRLLFAMALASGITSVLNAVPNMTQPFTGLAPRP